MPDHSPTPWTFTHNQSQDHGYITDASGLPVIDDGGKWSEPHAMLLDDMEHVVRAVNMHDELIELLSNIVGFDDSTQDRTLPTHLLKDARKLLAKAKP